jgi:hypothetical protein
LKEAWNTSINAEDKRENLQALSLAKECYSMKLDLPTNARVVDDAIRFVSEHQDRKVVEQQNNNNTQTTNKSSTTINQIF